MLRIIGRAGELASLASGVGGHFNGQMLQSCVQRPARTAPLPHRQADLHRRVIPRVALFL